MLKINILLLVKLVLPPFSGAILPYFQEKFQNPNLREEGIPFPLIEWAASPELDMKIP